MNSAIAFVPALLVLIAVQPNEAMEMQKPIILFVVSDDLATRVGCYGDPTAITPNPSRTACSRTRTSIARLFLIVDLLHPSAIQL